MSDVQIQEDHLTASIGPIRPGLGNWLIFLTLVCAVVISPWVWFQDWWFVGPPAALLLTYLFRRSLSPVEETLRITADEILVERSRKIPIVGKDSVTERVWTDETRPPRVYRLSEAVEAYQEGNGPRPGIGYQGLIFESKVGDKATFGVAIMNQNKIVSDAGYQNNGELDWLKEIATLYIRYVRGEAPTSGDEVETW